MLRGAAVLAHTNTRKHLASTTRVEAWDHTFPPAPGGAVFTNYVYAGV